MSFEQTTSSNRSESLIPNTQIESMFLRICEDEEMQKYTKLIDDGHVSLATAYASNKVYKVFYMLVDHFEKFGMSVSQLKDLKEKGKNHVTK